MATVTKPLALNESFKTTEQNSRNVADVLAQELSGIASAITGGSDKAPKTDIATVEPSNTASRAYSVGELVYVNGNLYKVITAIAIGSTFTVGTNIQSTTISGRIADTTGVAELRAELLNTKYAWTSVTVPANSFSTVDIDISNKPATFKMLSGFMISEATGLTILRIWFSSNINISVRLENPTTNNITCDITVYYI